MTKLIGFISVLFFLAGLQTAAHAAKPIKGNRSVKERLVLMPLRIPDEDKNLIGAMETALVQGLQQKYEVFSGEQVAAKAKAIFNKESRNMAKKECDEARCMQDIAIAFQTELIATTSITKRSGGYFLALSIQNIFDNKVVYSNSVPCENCNEFQVINQLKQISGASFSYTQTETIAKQQIEPKIIEPTNRNFIAPAMVPIPGKDYEIGKYEVTQAEWKAVMGENPSLFNSCGDSCPVEQVSWNDIQIYLQKLNAKTGKQYRLPSEAEWEYACYGGSQAEYCGSNEVYAVAWYRGNSNDTPHPVGLKQGNGYGLYDMSGNMWEWQSDCGETYGCSERVLRGGSYATLAKDVRATGRRYQYGSDGRTIAKVAVRLSGFGFRLARTLS